MNNTIRELSMEEMHEVSGGQFWKEVLKALIVVESMLGLIDDVQNTVIVPSPC